MKPRRRTLAAGLIGALVGALVLAAGLALSGGDEAPASARGPSMGTSDPNAPYDLRFIDEMTVHHQGAVMSAPSRRRSATSASRLAARAGAQPWRTRSR